MKRRLTCLIGLLCMLWIAGCGGETEKQSCEIHEDPDQGITTVECPDGSSTEIPHGEETGGCTVEDHGDGTSTISCDDGTEVTVEDGSSCTVVEADDETTISCEDGTEATITDGEDGNGCSVEDHDDGSATLTCDDGTEATVEAAEGGCTVEDVDDGATISCDDGTEVTVEDGDGCSVAENDDGTATISCDDGTEADVGCTAEEFDDETVISCGEDDVTIPHGEDGDDCSVDELDDGDYEITCGADSVVVTDGEDGDGESCTIKEGDDEVVLLSCPDGTEVGLETTEVVDIEITDYDVIVDRNHIDWEVTLTNHGPDVADGFWVDYFLDESDQPNFGENVVGNSFEWSFGIDVDEEVTVGNEMLDVDDGTYESWLLADTNRDVTDFDRSNNTVGPETVDIDYDAPEADLRIDSFQVTTDGSDVDWEATIANGGPEEMGAFRVDYFTDEDFEPGAGDYGDDYVEISSLDSGETIDVDGTVEDLADGDYSSWAYVDTRSFADDPDLTNNVAGPDEFILDEDSPDPEVDLEVTGFDAIGDDGEVAFVVEITNNGPEDADSFLIDYFFDEADAPQIGDVGDATEDVDGLEAGDSTSIFETFSRSEGTYDGWVVVYPSDNYDQDLDNNVAGPETYQVTSE